MVRLLQSDQKLTKPTKTDQFQSHNGAIAAPVSDFNTSANFVVSIPQWCDCCLVYHQLHLAQV